MGGKLSHVTDDLKYQPKQSRPVKSWGALQGVCQRTGAMMGRWEAASGSMN